MTYGDYAARNLHREWDFCVLLRLNCGFLALQIIFGPVSFGAHAVLEIEGTYILMKKNLRLWWLLPIALLALPSLAACYALFSSFSGSEERIVYLDDDDNIDSVYNKVCSEARFPANSTFRFLTTAFKYGQHIRPGRYDVGSGTSVLSVFRNLRNGNQSPTRLTIPVLRTTRDLADLLGRELHAPADSFYAALTNKELLERYGKTPETAVCLFLPNTYEVYWTLSPAALLARMNRESKAFWTPERLAKAQADSLSPEEVMTVASIVEQETAYNPEKPMVAAMYLNRLHKRMPLQADPTVKFALGNFGLRRILHEHLKVDSPYNTYKHAGLPPGPICIPSLSSVNAVLDHAHHDYLYMCAKEDFSGSHNFAVTYGEHLKNAAKYVLALNARGIK